MDEPVRCAWVGDDPIYVAYHDDEWGVPSHDDAYIFEMLLLEGAQAGLNWRLILGKREGYRRAYDGFDPSALRLGTTHGSSTSPKIPRSFATG